MNALPVKFDEDGLVAAVIQDDASGDVLMLAYMNATALELTRTTGRTHFWSRSRAKLWKKGETSGHVQIVKSIHVNCYENSLLIRVDQIGAACHTGFPTCYYRELTPANELVATRIRSFDPEVVYGANAQIELWLGAYQWLADHDLAAVSSTSRLLRGAEVPALVSRISEELLELGGVVSGDHGHLDQSSDILLEGSQVLYWLVLAELRSGRNVPRLASQFKATAGRDELPLAATMLELARDLESGSNALARRSPRIVAVVEQAARSVGLALRDIIEHDLSELRARPYLAEYFASANV